MTHAHWLLILFWALYGFIHSWLASTRAKNQAQKLLKSSYKYYRLAYNLVAIMGLIGLLLWGALISDPRIWPQSTLLTFVSMLFAAYGVIVIRLSFKQFSIREFLGFSTFKGRGDQSTLQKQGLLRFVRHPIYSGTLLITIGFVLFAPNLTNLIHAVCIIAYILIGVRYEELKLIEEYGEAYSEFKKKVPMLIPKIPWWK